jgi:hypothetical protein
MKNYELMKYKLDSGEIFYSLSFDYKDFVTRAFFNEREILELKEKINVQILRELSEDTK